MILSLKNSGGTTYATTLIGEPRNLDINGCIFDDDSGDHKLNEASHGGQISGGPSVGELINMVALAIQKKVTVRELDIMQIATHPMLTSAPTVHPIINAAHQALVKLRTNII